MKTNLNNFLTAQQVADRLGVTRGRVTHLVTKGDLPCQRFGMQLVFERSIVESFAKIPRKVGRPKKVSERAKKPVDKR